MKICLWSVGKKHDDYVEAGIEIFSARIRHYFPVEWLLIPSPKNAGALARSELKKKEAESILLQLKTDDQLILLDETGKSWSSEQLASFIQEKANESTKRLIFLIGGAFGVDGAVKKRADLRWSLSKLVFPHQLVRLILSEQLYRACTIIKNEKYHHQ